ncbi:16S rRNA (adenine(1518)-N(6)/adenine(1519)-N(6))-dimethyltransferase RsmA [Chrysiogenes arsenatis]|uniref:16S rRNA (adenine(1518)-N(6)/adenine(1519)-N(6))- dimethyltransferase RsmA n=1 Tax=Chrysiogenes arsenatis TaxID=309797 RepID=UPI000405950D|nr:16S rRNA (adenine(1518)-N(6)/adenine(1519)-N(6))-dimethyltransferase RsmA [Chrysiogenes arsenatis]
MKSARQLLHDAGLFAKKRFGQNFLVDMSVVQRIVDGSRVTCEDAVLEIGPGLGVMTRLLASRVKTLYALDADRDMIAELEASELAQMPHVSILHGDALRYPFDAFPTPLHVVANLPYNISSQVLIRFLECQTQIASFTVMLQKEMADRLLAPPGGKDYGPLAVYMALYCEMAPVIKRIGPKSFYPPPKIDSTVIRGVMRTNVTLPPFAFMSQLVRQGFSQRRKTMNNALKGSPFVAEWQRGAAAIGVSPDVRAETITPQQYAMLAEFYQRELTLPSQLP